MTAETLEQRVTATEFLTELFAHVDDGYLHLFALDRVNGERHVVWRPVDKIHSLTAEARKLSGTCCVWFGAAPRVAELGGQRGGAEQCTVITAAWVDIDVAGPNHVAENLPPDRDAARLLLADYPLAPSAIIDTGGGIQAWWFLNEPVDRDAALPFLTRWGATWSELGAHRRWHVDNVFDIARIMRLPATVNRKSTPANVVVTDWNPEIRYGIDDLDQWTIEPPAPPARIPLRSVPYIGPERPGDAFNAAVDPAKLLEGAGFVYDHEDRTDGASHYRAPHHAGERGVTGATVYPDGHTTIYSETYATSSGLTVKRPYDAFGLYTHLNHRGDWRAASDELAKRGYGTKAVTGDIRSLGAPHSSGEPTDDDLASDDWSTISLVEIAAKIRDGTFKPTMPTVLEVNDSLPLFYPKRINSLFGESGGGKSWIALAAVAEVVRKGQRALFIDYEDDPGGIAERLVLLDLTDEEVALVDYRNPTTGIGMGIEQLEREAEANTYALIVIDSTGEAMAAGGIDSNADADVARWFAVVKHLARLPGGPAVIVLDHVPKAADAPSNFAIGSQRKRAAVTGAAYRVDTLKEPAKGRDGRLKLTVAKDRAGNRPKGATAAIVDVHTEDQRLRFELHLTDAQAAEAAGQKFRPTVYMERLSRWLEDNPHSTKRAVIAGTTGKREVLEIGLDALVDEGFVKIEPGAHGALRCTVVRMFRELDDHHQPVDNFNVCTAAQPRPTAAQAAVTNVCTAAPPLKGAAVTGDTEAILKDSTAAPVDNSTTIDDEGPFS